VALGIADRVWTIGDLLDATLALEPNRPIRTKRNFTVIEGGEKLISFPQGLGSSNVFR
jgi:hypothetical protein